VAVLEKILKTIVVVFTFLYGYCNSRMKYNYFICDKRLLYKGRECFLRKFDKWILYCISLFPVYLIILIEKWDNRTIFLFKEWFFYGQNLVVLIMFLLLISSFLLQNLFIKRIESNTSSGDGTIKKISNNNIDFLSYMSSYLLPLFTFNTDGYKALAIFIITYFFMGMLYVKTNLYYSNIGLVFSRFNIYKVSIEDNLNSKKPVLEGILLVRGHIPSVGEKINYSDISYKDDNVPIFVKS